MVVTFVQDSPFASPVETLLPVHAPAAHLLPALGSCSLPVCSTCSQERHAALLLCAPSAMPSGFTCAVARGLTLRVPSASWLSVTSATLKEGVRRLPCFRVLWLRLEWDRASLGRCMFSSARLCRLSQRLHHFAIPPAVRGCCRCSTSSPALVSSSFLQQFRAVITLMVLISSSLWLVVWRL